MDLLPVFKCSSLPSTNPLVVHVSVVLSGHGTSLFPVRHVLPRSGLCPFPVRTSGPPGAGPSPKKGPLPPSLCLPLSLLSDEVIRVRNDKYTTPVSDSGPFRSVLSQSFLGLTRTFWTTKVSCPRPRVRGSEYGSRRFVGPGARRQTSRLGTPPDSASGESRDPWSFRRLSWRLLRQRVRPDSTVTCSSLGVWSVGVDCAA